jgi:hypothetical protein
MPFVMVGPDRDKHNPNKVIHANTPSTSLSQSRPGSAAETILFVDSQHCEFSVQLMQLSYDHGLSIQFYDISEKQAPSWLPVTPTVLVGQEVFCGDSAFAYIESLLRPAASSASQYQVQSPQQQVQQIAEEVPLAGPKVGQASAMKKGGASLASAFKAPVERDEEELARKYSGSVEANMQKMLAARK